MPEAERQLHPQPDGNLVSGSTGGLGQCPGSHVFLWATLAGCVSMHACACSLLSGFPGLSSASCNARQVANLRPSLAAPSRLPSPPPSQANPTGTQLPRGASSLAHPCVMPASHTPAPRIVTLAISHHVLLGCQGAPKVLVSSPEAAGDCHSKPTRSVFHVPTSKPMTQEGAQPQDS